MFGDLTWVEGELANLGRSRAGHVYFDLVDADHDGSAGVRPSLSVALFNNDRLRVNQFLTEQGGPVRMTDGIRIRIGGRLRTYPARSSVQLVMDRIDPAFTLGLLGQERARLLAALSAEGVLRANAELPMPALPLRVALVTSGGSAAHADALDEFARSGFGFRVSFLDARTQGAGAEASIVAALRTASSLPIDVVVLVRGGGATTDLATFDSEIVARSIAGLARPVITGIGHEVDRTVADEVAHTTHKTPTAAAASLVQVVGDAQRQVHNRWVSVGSAARSRLVRADLHFGQLGLRTGGTALRLLDRHCSALDAHVHRVRAASGRLTVSERIVVDHLARRIGPAGDRQLERVGQRLANSSVRAAVHDPAGALARGWSITRRGDGRLVRSVNDVVAGDLLHTTLAVGALRSTVNDDETATATVRVDGDR